MHWSAVSLREAQLDSKDTQVRKFGVRGFYLKLDFISRILLQARLGRHSSPKNMKKSINYDYFECDLL